MRKVLTENQLRRLVRVLVKEIAEMDPKTGILTMQSLVHKNPGKTDSLGVQFDEIDRLRRVLLDVFSTMSPETADKVISDNMKKNSGM